MLMLTMQTLPARSTPAPSTWRLSPVLCMLLWAGALTGAAYSAGVWPSGPRVGAWASTLVQSSITLLGLLMVAAALVASMQGTHLARMMRRTGHHRDLLLTLLAAALGMLGTAAAGLAALVQAQPHAWLLAALVGLPLAGMGAVISAGRKLWLVLGALPSAR